MRLRYGMLALAFVGLTLAATVAWAAAEAEPAAEPGTAAGPHLTIDEHWISMYKTIGLASAAAFVTAVSIIGSGYAVGRIGSAALGAAAEKPELLTRSLLFVALAEGLAVLGFAIAMMLVMRIGD
ncbi:MAG: H+transporting two-sector ATPase C subunit [Acidobacteria bacterium]|nr:H+transporting two-sector ATPase C subunit [Acidobacteriota bacterium]